MRGTSSFLATLVSRERRLTSPGVEEVNHTHALQFRMQLGGLGFVCGEASGGEMLATRLSTNCASQTTQLCRDRRKLFVARFAKGGNDFIIGCAFDRGGLKHSCFTAGRFDLLLQPLKIFVRFFVGW